MKCLYSTVGRGSVLESRTTAIHRQGCSASAARCDERIVPKPGGAGVAHQGARVHRLGRDLRDAGPQRAPAQARQGDQGDQGGHRPRREAAAPGGT